MLEYVQLLAVQPSAATADHVAALRQVGFGDAEIFEIVMVTAYYALRCRMANGLGVEVDARGNRMPGSLRRSPSTPRRPTAETTCVQRVPACRPNPRRWRRI
jgi:uncharacterized protein YciW